MARSRMHEDKSASSKSSNVTNRLRYFSERSDAITETVRHLVEIESPSDVKAAVDRLGAFLASRFEQLGGRAKFHRAQDFGDHLQVFSRAILRILDVPQDVVHAKMGSLDLEQQIDKIAHEDDLRGQECRGPEQDNPRQAGDNSLILAVNQQISGDDHHHRNRGEGQPATQSGRAADII